MPNKTTPGFDAQEYMRGYMRDYRKGKTQIRKEVSFTEGTEKELLDWLTEQSEGFSPYVKRLIRQDMEAHKDSP